MARSIPTVDELVAVLQRSSLPTVIVEGKQDILVYRRFEEILGTGRADFLPCGGRDAVLAMYMRRAEVPNIPVCFVVDQDMWLIAGIPEGYEDLILTSGYSIENDVYQDAAVERLLFEPERQDHKTLVMELCRWFAFQIEKFLAGKDFLTDPHLNHLVPLEGFTCSPAVLAEHGFVEPNAARREEIQNNYQSMLRGKLLYEIIVRFSHAPGRVPRYSYNVLWDISVAFGINGPLLTRLLEAVCKCLGIAFPNRQLPLPIS